MKNENLSTTYKLLRALGFNYSEKEYGQVSLIGEDDGLGNSSIF